MHQIFANTLHKSLLRCQWTSTSDSIAHQACIKTKNPTRNSSMRNRPNLPQEEYRERTNQGYEDADFRIRARIKPQKSLFVARDRIQAGLSHGIVLLQSTEDGGSMHAIRIMQSLQDLCSNCRTTTSI